MEVKPIPERWHSVTSRLIVQKPSKLVDFLRHAVGANGSFRNDGSSELRIGDSIVMVSGDLVNPSMPALLYLYIDDMDEALRRAIEASATSIDKLRDLHCGDRRATVRDLFGNIWQIATHKEDLTLEETRKRMATASKSC
jgi:uncharacterized glyoxalase superfamily protein PhnB